MILKFRFLGSSGLLLLAAAAEQKRKDEEGRTGFFCFVLIKIN
jgi:hypothetical protein